MNILTLTRFEVKKLVKQQSVRASYVLVCILSVLFFLLNYTYRSADQYSGITLIMETLQVLHSILFILPVIAIILTVATLSWEQYSGTLGSLLTRPVSRENVIVSKFLALFCVVGSLYYLAFVCAMVLGLRWGYGGEFLSFLPRGVLIFFEYILGTMIFVSIVCVIAFFVFNHLLCLLLSVGVYGAWLLVESFEQVRPYLFSYHVYTITQLMEAHLIDYTELLQSQVVILLYLLGIMFLVTTLWEKRDLRV